MLMTNSSNRRWLRCLITQCLGVKPPANPLGSVKAEGRRSPEIYLGFRKSTIISGRCSVSPGRSPHPSYDCSIDLIPGSTPPYGKLFSLLVPEHKALKKYLPESLSAGTVISSTSQTGAVLSLRRETELHVPARYLYPFLLSSAVHHLMSSMWEAA